MEMVGPKYRLVAGILIEMFWSFGFLNLVGLAYWLRDETYLQLTLTAPSLIFISYYWLVLIPCTTSIAGNAYRLI